MSWADFAYKIMSSWKLLLIAIALFILYSLICRITDIFICKPCTEKKQFKPLDISDMRVYKCTTYKKDSLVRESIDGGTVQITLGPGANQISLRGKRKWNGDSSLSDGRIDLRRPITWSSYEGHFLSETEITFSFTIEFNNRVEQGFCRATIELDKNGNPIRIVGSWAITMGEPANGKIEFLKNTDDYNFTTSLPPPPKNHPSY